MNFEQITAHISLGSAPQTVDDLRTLYGKGVARIIDCRAEADDQALLSLFTEGSFEYLHDGVPDWTPAAATGHQPLPSGFFVSALNFWQQAPFQEHLYVHCHSGLNRSVTLVYFLLRVLGLSEPDAITLLNTHRVQTIWADFADAPWRQDAEKALQNWYAPTAKPHEDWGRENNQLLKQILAIDQKIEAFLITDIKSLGITIDKPIKQ